MEYLGIVCFHDLELLQDNLRAIREYTRDHEPLVLIWDNSTDEVNNQWLKSNYQSPGVPIFELVNQPTNNIGNCAALNRIMEHAINTYSDLDHITFLSHDTIVVEGWLDALLNAYHATPDVGIVAFGQANKGFTPDAHGKVPEVATELFMLRTQTYVENGPFDEENFFWYSFDSEYQQRMNLMTKWRTYVVDHQGYDHVKPHHSTLIDPRLWDQAKRDSERWGEISEVYNGMRQWDHQTQSEMYGNIKRLREIGKNELASDLLNAYARKFG